MAVHTVVAAEGHGGCGFPQYLAIANIERPHASVESATEGQLRRHRGGSRQAVVVGAAVLFLEGLAAAGPYLSQPHQRSVFHGKVAIPGNRVFPERVAAGGIQRIQPGCGCITRYVALWVRDGHNQPVAGKPHAPMHTAVGAALADTCLPDQCTVGSGVERMHHAGFLAREQQLTAIGRLADDDGGPEVEVGPRLAGTIGSCILAGRIPHIVHSGLIAPHGFPAVEVQCNDGVAGVGCGSRQVLPGTDVQAVARSVNGRRCPHGRPRRAVPGAAVRPVALQPGIRRCVPGPELFSARGVQRDHATV